MTKALVFIGFMLAGRELTVGATKSEVVSSMPRSFAKPMMASCHLAGTAPVFAQYETVLCLDDMGVAVPSHENTHASTAKMRTATTISSMKTSEIYEALKQRGIEVPGKVPQNNVSAHLAHHKNMFVSSKDGWVLRSANLIDDTENTNAHASH